MAETMNELQNLEYEFVALRCKLRQLQGKVGFFVETPHTTANPYQKNPNDLAASDMLNLINITLGKLDQYETKKDYRFARYNAWENIYNCIEVDDKIRSCKHVRRHRYDLQEHGWQCTVC